MPPSPHLYLITIIYGLDHKLSGGAMNELNVDDNPTQNLFFYITYLL